MRLSHLAYVVIGIFLGLAVSGKTPLISVVVRVGSRDTNYLLATEPTHLTIGEYTTGTASFARSDLSADDAKALG